VRRGRLSLDAASRHVAVFQGLLWLARLTLDEDEPTSDEAQCFLTVSRNAADPFLARHAQAIHAELVTGRPLDLDPLAATEEPGDFIDALSFCTQNRLLGQVHPQEAAVRECVARRPAEFFWRLSPEGLDSDACTTLILHYHFRFLGLERERTLGELLRERGTAAVACSRELTEDDLEQQIYFLTHWVYALTDYGTRPLPAGAEPSLHRCLRRLLPDAVAAGNVETLGEVVECLRLFGHGSEERLLAPALRLLLRRQNPDGSWGSARYETQRHSTWCAVNALYDYRAAAGEHWGPPWERSVLEPLLTG
jgi:hypothetical protein